MCLVLCYQSFGQLCWASEIRQEEEPGLGGAPEGSPSTQSASPDGISCQAQRVYTDVSALGKQDGGSP